MTIEREVRHDTDPRPLRSPEVYQALLDPDHALPPVTLKDTGSPGLSGWDNIQFLNAAGEMVGRFLLSKGTQPGTVYIVDVYRDAAYKDQKYGRSAYIELVKKLAHEGTRLVSGHTLSRDTAKIWEWMVDKGAARLVEGRGVNERVKNLHYTTSRYEII